MGTKQLIVVFGLMLAATANAAGLGNLLNDLTKKPTPAPTQPLPQAPKPTPQPIKK